MGAISKTCSLKFAREIQSGTVALLGLRLVSNFSTSRSVTVKLDMGKGCGVGWGGSNFLSNSSVLSHFLMNSSVLSHLLMNSSVLSRILMNSSVLSHLLMNSSVLSHILIKSSVLSCIMHFS